MEPDSACRDIDKFTMEHKQRKGVGKDALKFVQWRMTGSIGMFVYLLPYYNVRNPFQ